MILTEKINDTYIEEEKYISVVDIERKACSTMIAGNNIEVNIETEWTNGWRKRLLSSWNWNSENK